MKKIRTFLEQPRPVLLKSGNGDGDYKIELTFSSKSELTFVNSTKPMPLEMLNHHLAVATLYVAQQLSQGPLREVDTSEVKL